jgi:N-acyl-D-aspartate/D-glutamate deacylase
MLSNWVALDREAQGCGGLSVDNAAELKRLRSEVAESAWGLSDAGAQVKYVCAMSTPTFDLVHWVHDRSHDRLPVEFIVQKMTSRNAHLYGLNDRGTLQVGSVPM